MAIDDELNYTPNFTMSTFQTRNDIANICINSLILVFILVNIGSAISKLVYFTRGKTFNYKSWVRAFVFVNSDDPLRIFGWLFRKYNYREPEWSRYPNKLRIKRLILPLLARATIFIVSIASIAVGIPQNKVLNGCVNGDYRVSFDTSKSKLIPNLKSICSNVPLISDLGDPNTTVSYCSCPQQMPHSFDPQSTSAILSSVSNVTEDFSIFVSGGKVVVGILFYVEWKPGSTPDKTFRSMLSQSITDAAFADLVAAWFVQDNPECTLIKIDASPPILREYSCKIDSRKALDKLESRLRTSIQWQRTKDIQKRLVVKKIVSEEDIQATGELPLIKDCVVPVIVNRPIANTAPLLIMLAVWTLFNIIISAFVSRHDNALDAGFHIIKEALGQDTTSNPLEECTEWEEITGLKLTKWQCGGGGAHVGFIGRQGDVPVEKFHESTDVCGCAIVGTEQERARAQYMAPTGFAAPV